MNAGEESLNCKALQDEVVSICNYITPGGKGRDAHLGPQQELMSYFTMENHVTQYDMHQSNLPTSLYRVLLL